MGGTSYVYNNRFDNKHFINDYCNENDIIIIEIKKLQQLVNENNSYLEKEENDKPKRLFYKESKQRFTKL